MRTPSSPACWTSTRLRAAISIGEQIDPAVYPTFAARYGAGNGVRRQPDPGHGGGAAPCWTRRTFTSTTTPTTIPTASGLTVSSRSPPPSTGSPAGEPSQAYYTTGHGEKTLSSTPAGRAGSPEHRGPSPSACCRGRCLRTARCSSSTAPPRTLPGRRGAVDETAFLQDYLDGGGARCWS